MTFRAFPKIKQFRDVIHNVKINTDYRGKDDEGNPIYSHDTTHLYPKIRFVGSPKLHGTNSAVRKHKGKLVCQSRTRDISIEKDNAGFSAFVAGLSSQVIDLIPNETIVYGEWCGGSIQKGVALNQLPKMFVVFAIRDIATDEWLDLSLMNDVYFFNDHLIYLINQFPSFEIEIDFENPAQAANTMVKMVEDVEKECPVGKFFGVSGIGEGIVFKPYLPPECNDSGLWFKVKGEKHQSSRVKTLIPVDIEKLNNVNDFVQMSVTDSRLEQGLDYLRENNLEVEVKNTGVFLKWIVSDILKEELDQLVGNDLCAKDVTKSISNEARKFWLKKVNEF